MRTPKQPRRTKRPHLQSQPAPLDQELQSHFNKIAVKSLDLWEIDNPGLLQDIIDLFSDRPGTVGAPTDDVIRAGVACQDLCVAISVACPGASDWLDSLDEGSRLYVLDWALYYVTRVARWRLRLATQAARASGLISDRRVLDDWWKHRSTESIN